MPLLLLLVIKGRLDKFKQLESIIDNFPLRCQFLFDDLHLLLLFLVEVFLGLDHIQVLVAMKCLLEYPQIEQVYSLK